MSTQIDQSSVSTTNLESTSLSVSGPASIATILRPYVAKGVSYNAQTTDEIIELTATGLTLTLPTPVGIAGKTFEVILTAATSSGTVGTAAGNINGSSTYSLSAQYKYVRVISNGANWLITGSN